MSDFAYVTKMIVASALSTTEMEIVLVHHRSMEEMVEWATFHNLIIAFEPVFKTAIFSAHRADGSPLNQSEETIIRAVANESQYRKRLIL